MPKQVQHDGVGLRFTVNLSNCVTLNLIQGLMQRLGLLKLAMDKPDYTLHENLFDCRWW